MVVIPALAEPDLTGTLASVAAASSPDCGVEILVIINDATDATDTVRALNAQALDAARAWARRNRGHRLRCHVLDYRGLAAAHAGVGLARKLGLDLGLERLAATASGSGVLVWLDADCRVSPDYLTAISEFFGRCGDAVAATVYFEHRCDDNDEFLRDAIATYELHLRCYRQGLLAAGSRYGHHTVGSTIAVRSTVYAQEGGMNRRAAGEDFYFLNKMRKRGTIGDINDAVVYPAARVSSRVPFGTGAAMSSWTTDPVAGYAPAVYTGLAEFLQQLEQAVLAQRSTAAAYSDFLQAMRFEQWRQKTLANVATVPALRRQLHRWMDGFRTLKFVHWLTDERYPRVPVQRAAREMLVWQGIAPAPDVPGLLDQYRRLDRNGSSFGSGLCSPQSNAVAGNDERGDQGAATTR